MNLRIGDVWLDSTDNNPRKAVIEDLIDGHVLFQLEGVGEMDWLIEDFLRDAVPFEVANVRSILKHYENRSDI